MSRLTWKASKKRKEAFLGPNVIWEVKDKLLRVRFLGNFMHFMAVLLWVGGIVALIRQLLQIGIAIRMVSLINIIPSSDDNLRRAR
jgi:hypothetical protein